MKRKRPRKVVRNGDYTIYQDYDIYGNADYVLLFKNDYLTRNWKFDIIMERMEKHEKGKMVKII